MAASPAANAANTADKPPAAAVAAVATDDGNTSSGVVSRHQNCSHSSGLVYLHPQHAVKGWKSE
jgi:hypothetical protein